MNNRIRAYIKLAPEAISGQRGHNTTLRIARTLYNGFALSRDQVLEWLHAYNSRLSNKWTVRDLEHKADSAASGTYDKPRGWMQSRHPWKPRRIVIRPPKISVETRNSTKRYVLATDATDIPDSQSTRHTPVCAQSGEVSETSVALVAADSSNAQQAVADTPNSSMLALPIAETEQDIEARRIAGELVKLQKDGAIAGPHDTEAVFYATVVRDFGATYTGRTA